MRGEGTFRGWLVVASLLAACTERDPLDSASASIGGTSTQGVSTTGEGETTATSTASTVAPTTTSGPATTDASATTVLDTGDPSDTDGVVTEGQYLFAVSTIIATDLPLQYLATNTLTQDGGQTWLRLELQPLSLAQGKVTTPREPVGAPLIFDMIPVTGGSFELDFGSVMLVGATNPITGSDITTTLVMRGTFVSEDFYCGDVQGQVTSPLMADITGSTFAAVRLQDAADLPLDVAINCSSETVTDQ